MESVEHREVQRMGGAITLQDGTVLRGKVAVLDVKRAVGQFNVEGDPVYVLQLTMVNQ